MTVFFRDHAGKAPLAQHIPAPSRSIRRAGHTSWYAQTGKRLLDLTLACLIVPQILLIVGILALIVASRGGSPFYAQVRVGRNGKLYKMWKLRSMVPDAEQALEAYLAENPQARAEWDLTQKLRNDPRITAFGRFLRRSSLDELPQLWNVLRGDMSLVGPRPMMPCQRDLYVGQEYYDLRPGITGLWQVKARNSSSFADRATYDTRYSQTLSFIEDCRIIAATIKVVFRATGH